MERLQLAKDCAIVLNFEKGEMDKIEQKGVCLTAGSTPLFSVKLRGKTGASRVVASTECTLVSYENFIAKYTHEDFDLTLKIANTDGAMRLRASVKNNTDEVLEWLELGSFSVGGKLKDEEDGKGAIVYPYNEGCLVTNMSYRERMPFKYTEPEYPSKGFYSIFPNMIFGQFIAYTVNGGGIYLGMHDEERATKHIDFKYEQENIKIFMRVYCGMGYGENYAMPFDCVTTLFEGDWYKAADIYYDWFTNHLPQGLQKIEENTALPAWYAENPLVVAYPIRGWHDTDLSENGLYPYPNAFPILQEFAEETDCKVMALLMHWEGTAPWAPPFVWPPYGGEETFSSFVQEAHKKDMLVGLYCSGMGWTQQSNILASYSCEEKFEGLGIADCVCTDSDGRMQSDICLAQRKGYDLCPANDKVKEILKTEFDKLCKSGVDYVQALDQNHGGNSYFCYSDKHGHPPAPGKWQQEETNKMLASIDKGGVVFGCESAAAEPFLAQLSFSDNRFELNHYVGRPIPLYAYVYHEYVNNFMGNQICAILGKQENNFTYRLAYSFAAGDMLTLVINGKGELLYSWCDYVEPKEEMVNKTTALAFIKTLNAWRMQGGKNFLRFGKMLAPIPVECEKEYFRLECSETPLEDDGVLSTAYAYKREKVQFLINYNLHPVDVAWEKEYDVYLDADLTSCVRKTNRITMEPLSVVMLDLD